MLFILRLCFHELVSVLMGKKGRYSISSGLMPYAPYLEDCVWVYMCEVSSCILDAAGCVSCMNWDFQVHGKVSDSPVIRTLMFTHAPPPRSLTHLL